MHNALHTIKIIRKNKPEASLQVLSGLFHGKEDRRVARIGKKSPVGDLRYKDYPTWRQEPRTSLRRRTTTIYAYATRTIWTLKTYGVLVRLCIICNPDIQVFNIANTLISCIRPYHKYSPHQRYQYIFMSALILLRNVRRRSYIIKF
jgi:hypothetical protein